jgi:hypothetical protein
MKTQNTPNKKSPGRPRAFDQHKLNFYVLAALVRARLTKVHGRTPSDTEVEAAIAESGHRILVAADRNQLTTAQQNRKWMRRNSKIAKLRTDNFGTRSHLRNDIKTIRNFHGLAKKEAAEDPTFIPFANQILAEYGLADRSEPVGGAGWRPPIRRWN